MRGHEPRHHTSSKRKRGVSLKRDRAMVRGACVWIALALAALLLSVDASGNERDTMEERPLLTSMFLLDNGLRRKVADPSGGGARRTAAMLASILDPAESPAHRRGAFSDTLGFSILGSAAGGATQLKAAGGDPTPAPFTSVEPLTLETLDGEVTLEGSKGQTFLISVYYDTPRYSDLWTKANLEHISRRLPASAHLVFGLSSTAAAKDGVAPLEALRARFEKLKDYAKIAPRVHFLKKSLEHSCTADVFPNCPDTGHGWLGQTVNGWGTIDPFLTVVFDGRSEELPAAGDSGNTHKRSSRTSMLAILIICLHEENVTCRTVHAASKGLPRPCGAGRCMRWRDWARSDTHPLHCSQGG